MRPLLFAVAFLLAACGQSGDLYLRDQPAPQTVTGKTPAPVPAAVAEEDEKKPAPQATAP